MASRKARLDKLIEAWEPRLDKSFLDSIYAVRDAAQLDLIIASLERGSIEDAIKAVGFNSASFRPFDAALAASFEAGGNAAASAVPIILQSDGFRTVFQFDVRNPAAEEWLTRESSNKIVEILADQRNMIRDTLADNLERGINPRTAALDLVGRVNTSTGNREGGMIGLTQSQAEWVRNYEAELRSDNPLAALERQLRDKRFDGAVRKAAASGEPIPDGKITSMVDAYRNRALRMRGETIGRTEALRSLHVAQKQSLQQAIDAGLDPDTVKQVWHATKDDRTRDSHAEMDGQERGLDEEFETGTGVLLEFPGDPSGPPEETINCRCWLEPLTDFLAEVEKEKPDEDKPDGDQPEEQKPEDGLPLSTFERMFDGTLAPAGFAEETESYFNKLPSSVVARMEGFGTKIQSGNMVTDVLPHLAGVTPRGWEVGTSWEMAEGLYSPSLKAVVTSQQRWNKYKQVVESGRTEGVFNHEVGHAYDDTFAGRASLTKEFQKAYQRDVEFIKNYGSEADKVDLKYYLQAGDAGASEAFAEGFAQGVQGTGAGDWNRDLFLRMFHNTVKHIKGLV